jgi:hypothetical protein
MAVRIGPNRNEIRPFQAFLPSSQPGLDPYLGTHGINPDQVSVTHQDPLNLAQEEKRACFQIGTNERETLVSGLSHNEQKQLLSKKNEQKQYAISC